MAEHKRNFYEILHVSRGAPEEIIRASYRTLMQQLKQHPDLGGDPFTAALINEAYATLTDHSKRERYDATLNDDTAQLRNLQGLKEQTLDPHRECIFCRHPHDHGRAIRPEARCMHCNSPLALAESKRLESRDARAVTRVQKRQTVELITHWPPYETISGRTEDISLSGIRVVTRQPFEAGQLLRLRCPELESVARVVNTRLHESGTTVEHESGLTFITLVFTKSVGAFVSRQV